MNPDAAHYRRLEARLGFDPDEGPSGTVDRLVKLALAAGEAASEEIAPACSGANPDKAIDEVLEPGRLYEDSGGDPISPSTAPLHLWMAILAPGSEVTCWLVAHRLEHRYRSSG